MIVFFLTGLWHGSSFNFIIWGLFYAVFLIIERLGFKNILERIPVILQHIYALLIIMIGWVFFRAEDLNSAISYINGLFIPAGNDFVNFQYIMTAQYWFFIIVGIFFSIPWTKAVTRMSSSKMGTLVYNVATLLVFYIAICYMVGSGYSPFLYFRF